MYPSAFEYVRAESLDHAVSLLHQYGDDARLLAGGASLVPMMKLRLANPAVVIDIGRLVELQGIQWQNGTVVLGALTRHAEAEQHADLRRVLPIVYDAASHIADVQVRNMGTVGGSLAEADPAGDWAPVVLALNGSIRCIGPDGARTIPAADLFVEAYTTALKSDEIITHVYLPVPGPRSGGAHLKLERRAGDFAIANVSVQLTLDDSGVCQTIGVGLGGVGLVPVKVRAAEDLLRGSRLTPDLVEEAASLVSRCTEGFTDVRGTAEYRQAVAGVLFRRALEVARRRALGQ